MPGAKPVFFEEARFLCRLAARAEFHDGWFVPLVHGWARGCAALMNAEVERDVPRQVLMPSVGTGQARPSMPARFEAAIVNRRCDA